MRKLPHQNEKGVAMMMALVTFLILSILVGELAYESGIYNGVIWRQTDQLRAKLLARSGLRLALLQLRAAEKAKQKAKGLGLGESTAITDLIWQTPLVLPPPAPPGFGEADKKSLTEFSDKLGLGGTISVSISGEGGRMNLNQLVWLAEKKKKEGEAATPPEQPEEKAKRMDAARQSFTEFVDQLLEQKRQSEDSFRDRYGSVRGEVLVKNILAWMDPNTPLDGEGLDKNDYYNRVEPTAYAIKNAPMASETELYMVKGLDDTLANLFADNFTTQPTGGLNVNEASPLMLRALIPELGDAELEKLLKRRTDPAEGRFKTADDFWGYMSTLGNFERSKQKLTEQGITVLGAETSFRVVVTAQSGQATRTWVAKVGPYPPKIEEPSAAPVVPQPAPTPTPNSSAAKDDSNPLNIIYLKAD